MNKKFEFYLVLIMATLVFLLSACDVVITTQTPEPQPAAEEMPQTTQKVGETSEPTLTALLEEVLVERTPVPTATPGALEKEIAQAISRFGLSRTQVLGLGLPDWINLGISLIIVLIGFLLGAWVVKWVHRKIVQHAPAGLDQVILEKVVPDLRWLVAILILHLATKRLTFVNAELKMLLGDVYFVLGLAFVFRIVSRLISMAEEWYRERSAQEGREEELAPILTLIVRLGRVVVAILFATVLLGHFGINVTAFAAALGIGGLAISLAAKDTIADAIAGFIILVDQPFRIGDRIEIEKVGTWGDVIEIGLRTTRIRTRDNRMVIVPNSIIGSNQVINYSYPDPRYRIETHIGIGYGTDIETARKIIIDTVRDIEGVLPDKPVDALYIEMGDAAMVFRVRWWIDSFADTRRAVDRVHTALQKALDEAGIETPYPTQSLNLQVKPEMAKRFSQILRESKTGFTDAGDSHHGDVDQ